MDNLHQEYHELTWRIPNHAQVVSSQESLLKTIRTFKFTSKSGVQYEWKVGYKIIENRDPMHFTLYFKLISAFPSLPKNVSIQWGLNKFCGIEHWLDYPYGKMEVPLSVTLGQDIFDPKICWPLEASFPANFQGEFCCKIQLVLHERSNVVTDEKLKSVFTFNHKMNSAKMLADAESADLKIVCADEVELKAHKLILKGQNPVFASMLTSGMVESNTGKLVIDDINSPTMKIVLHFLYTGDLLSEWNEPDNILEFVYAAGKYQLTDVLEMLDDLLGTFHHFEKDMELLSLTSKLSLKRASKRLFSHIKETVRKVETEEELIELFAKML